MINGCTVLAIEGTHSAGKSTLARALTRHLSAIGVDAVYLPDPARENTLVRQVVATPDAQFDLMIELDLFCTALSGHINAAQGHQVLITDKTIANVLAYARLVLPEAERQHPVLSALAQVCRAWQPYQLVIHCADQFPMDLTQDDFRNKVIALQTSVAESVHDVLAASGYPVLELPAGLSTTDRINWLMPHIEPVLAAA